MVGADGGCWGWDPPSSSVRRREELAVEKMGWWTVRRLLADWWEELAVTSGSSWDELPQCWELCSFIW